MPGAQSGGGRLLSLVKGSLCEYITLCKNGRMDVRMRPKPLFCYWIKFLEIFAKFTPKEKTDLPLLNSESEVVEKSKT